jgi:SPP1 gp7 family putative phage head morphogenesis protein
VSANPLYESRVVRAVRSFRAAIATFEASETRELALRYLDVEKALAANIEALAEQVNALYAAGEEPSWSQLYRLDRYQRLEAQLVSELARFNGWAADLITQHQLRLMLEGAENARTVMAMFDRFPVRMPHEAVQSVVGLASNGAPLGDLLATSYTAARRAITQELVRSVAIGRNPRATAAAIRRATSVPLERAVTIARTEQMRAYNMAATEVYRSMGVTQYQRCANLDENTCIGCLALNGEILDAESELSDHPRGKCSAIPIVPDAVNEPIPSSEAWFNAQPENVQRAIAGAGRFAAYKSGSASWSDLATHTHDPVWGGSVQPTPVSQLAA